MMSTTIGQPSPKSISSGPLSKKWCLTLWMHVLLKLWMTGQVICGLSWWVSSMNDFTCRLQAQSSGSYLCSWWNLCLSFRNVPKRQYKCKRFHRMKWFKLKNGKGSGLIAALNVPQSMGGTTSLERGSSEWSRLSPAKCWYLMPSTSSLWRMGAIALKSGGLSRAGSGSIQKPPCLVSGERKVKSGCFELCAAKSRCRGTGQCKWTTSRLGLSVIGSHSRVENTLDCQLRTNTMLWEMKTAQKVKILTGSIVRGGT